MSGKSLINSTTASTMAGKVLHERSTRLFSSSTRAVINVMRDDGEGFPPSISDPLFPPSTSSPSPSRMVTANGSWRCLDISDDHTRNAFNPVNISLTASHSSSWKSTRVAPCCSRKARATSMPAATSGCKAEMNREDPRLRLVWYTTSLLKSTCTAPPHNM